MTRHRHGLHRRRLVPALLSVGALLAVGGCGDSDPAIEGSGHWYRVRLVTGLGDAIPFFLRVPEDCEAEAATVSNGEERLRAPCRRSPVGFVIEFPVYATQLEAWFKPDGTLVGHWCREKPTGREPILALDAVPVPAPDPATRFPAASEGGGPPAQIAGDWRVVFDGHRTGTGVFRQKGSGIVTGSITIRSDYGDLRFLAGDVAGHQVRLSTFDGQRAFALEGRLLPDGTMEGQLITQRSRERFVAERDDDLEVPDPLGQIAFVPDQQRLDLEPLRDARFARKPVIVEVFGTWCPTCNDQAPVLVDLHRRYRSEGLEILGLAYEVNGVPAYRERRVREFKKKHGVEWEVLIADGTPEDLAELDFAGLGIIEGVPVVIFLNPDHTVHAIYSGFYGPATGELHERAKAELERLTNEILGSF